ncbi:MAG: hypothetical protein KIS92_00415 [Planctomycetota bacterium]|nr:hypothetical protein [Planctomycetota bacterium]
MGAIHFSIDPQLAALLAKHLNLSVFIETGTFKGDSVALARPFFRELHTCELSPELHAAAARRFAEDPAVRCHLGRSPEFLRERVKASPGQPAMYWLDAHWCQADLVAGEAAQCPLLEELDAIAPLHPDSVAWIDDARCFTAPPLAPLRLDDWPTFPQVLERIQKLGPGHRLVFANDTILVYPRAAEAPVSAYLREHGANWLAIAHSARLEGQLRAGIDAYVQEVERLRAIVKQHEAKDNGLLGSLRNRFKKPAR